MKRIKNFFGFIISFIITYNNIALDVCVSFFKMIPLIIVMPLAVFIIYILGWQVSWYKKLNYALKN